MKQLSLRKILIKDKRIAGAALICWVFASMVLFYSYSQPKMIEAAWFNDSWAYREAIPIAVHSAAETNVYETFQLSTSTLISAGKLQSACQDIRITDASGNMLKYHIGRTNGCNNGATTIDFLIPTMPSGAQTYYVYYGNPSAVSADAGAFSQSLCSNSCTTNPVLNSEENAPSPNLYWKFDDAQGITASDSSSNANNGTLGGTTKPTWQTEDMCIAGKCLYFDGSSSKVTGSKVVKNVQTVAMWVRPNTFGTKNVLIDLAGNGTKEISANSTGTITATGFTSPTIYVNGIIASTITANRWNFVEVTTGTGFDSVASFTIGTDSCSTTCANFIKGFVDEVKVYSSQRTTSQVKADYANRGAFNGTGALLGNNSTNSLAFSDGLVGYWKMDEQSWNGTAGEANDSSGNGNNMTAGCGGSGCTKATTATGKFSNGGSFNVSGLTSQFISNSDPTSQIYNFQTFTIGAWINTTNSTQTGGIVSFYNGQYFLDVNDGVGGAFSSINCGAGKVGLVFYSGGWKGICSNNTVNDGKWHHIVGVRNGSNSNIYLYIDGALDTSAVISGTISAGFGVNSLVGSIDSNYYDSYTGTIDEARIYNRAFSSSEVAQLYNFAPGPVGYWKFDDSSGSAVNDSSGNANNGSWQGTLGSQWKSGKYGGAGNFNGSDNGVVINPLNGNSKSEETWSFWIRQNVIDINARTLVSMGSGSGANGNLVTIVEQNGAISWLGTATGNNSVTANTWTHVAVVQSVSNSSCKIYLNGVLQASGSSCTSTASNHSFLELGADSQNGKYEQGMIDDFRYYNYARTQKQIIEDMGATHPAPGSPIGTPIGWWKFNEGYGTTAYNSGNCTSTCDGTINNAPVWTQSGKFGRALSFSSASSQYVAISSDVTPLKITGDITLSAWVKLTNNNTRHSIICKTTGTAASSSYCLYTNASGQLAMDISNGTIITTTSETSQTLANNTWYHVVGVYSASKSVTLYINGIQVVQNTSSIPTSIQDSTTTMEIGADNSGAAAAAADFMNGIIDEPKVFAGALTANQVNLDLNYGQAQQIGTLSQNTNLSDPGSAASQEYCVPGDSTACSAPVGRWDFEEGSGTTANDTSGNGNSGTITGAQYINGKVGKGLNFKGGTDTVSSIPTINGVKTIEFWIYPNSTTANMLELVTNTDYISASSGTISATGFTSPTIYVNGVASSTLTANKWQYLTVTTGVGINSTGIQLGRANGSSLNGMLDSIRMYNYVRTPAQIAWDYNRGGPVAWYKFDECQGATLNDSSGNGNSATVTIGGFGTNTGLGTCTTAASTSFWNAGISGKINYSGYFDGAGDYATAPDSSSLDPTSQITVAGWFNGLSTFTDIINKCNTLSQCSGATYAYKLDTNNIYLSFRVGSASSGVVVTTPIPSTNAWHHIVGTYDGSTLKLYVDGVLVNTTSGSLTLLQTTGNLTLARPESGNINYYSGQMDDIRIYNYALTATQIQILYNNGAANFAPVSGAP